MNLGNQLAVGEAVDHELTEPLAPVEAVPPSAETVVDQTPTLEPVAAR